jgi:hypothetical protein
MGRSLGPGRAAQTTVMHAVAVAQPTTAEDVAGCGAPLVEYSCDPH